MLCYSLACGPWKDEGIEATCSLPSVSLRALPSYGVIVESYSRQGEGTLRGSGKTIVREHVITG